MNNSIQHAVGAYQRVLNAARHLSPSSTFHLAEKSVSASPSRQDVIDVASDVSFPSFVGKLLSDGTSTIKQSELQMSRSVSADKSGKVHGESLVSTLSAINESEHALNLIIATRDKLVGAYQEIFRMQL